MKKSGISLIILIVTIIVLIILSSVVILRMSNDDVLGEASSTVDNLNKTQIISAIKLDIRKYKMEKEAQGIYEISEDELTENVIKKYGNIMLGDEENILSTHNCEIYYGEIFDYSIEGYEKLQYISCYSGAYINTKVQFDGNMKLKIKYNTPIGNGSRVTFGFRNSLITSGFYYCDNGGFVLSDGVKKNNKSYVAYVLADIAGKDTVVEYTKNTLIVNDNITETIKCINNFVPKLEFYLFCINNQFYVRHLSIDGTKIYYAKFWDENGNLIRNMIPVKRTADKVVGMYDKVNKIFYTNANNVGYFR